MQHVNRAVARLKNQTIPETAVDWRDWMKPSEVSRVVPAESLAEECKRQILLGREAESGMTLPWSYSQGKVLIRPGKLAVWTGWSHHGKSQMLKQVMLHAIHRGEKVLVASMEEEIGDVWRDMARLYVGNSDPTPRAIDSFVRFVTGKLWLYDQQGVVEAERMIAVSRYAASELRTTQAVIDSLMMLAVSRDDYDAQSRFVGELKSAAKDTQQTIHLVAHMRKRDGKGGDESPGTAHDIAGGHEIASKADYVLNVWRDKSRKDESEPSCILSVDKQRGQTNWIGKIKLYFHADSRQYVENPRHPIQFQDPWSDDEGRPRTQAQPGAMAANSASNGPAQRTADREPGCDDEPGREADGGYQF